MAQVLLVILVIVGILAALIAAGSGPALTTAAKLRAAVASCLVLSPLLLGGTLIGGFHAVPLAVLIVMALTGWLALADHSWWPALAVSAVTGLLLATVYPLIAPIAVGVFLGWWLTRGAAGFRAAVVPALAGVLAIGVLALGLWVVATRPDLVAILTATGGLARRSPPLLLAPILLALVSWGVARTWSQARGLAMVAGGTIMLAVVVGWLVWLAGAYSYYAEKTLWLGVVGLLPVAAARLGTLPDDSVRRSLGPVVLLGGLSFVPLLFGGGGAVVPSAMVIQGWWSPSATQVQVVQDLPNEAAHNYLWQVYGGPADRPVNNWLSAWNAPIGDINFSQPALSWTYGPTAEKAATYCGWLAFQPDSVVWTADRAQARALRSECDVAASRVRVLEQPG